YGPSKAALEAATVIWAKDLAGTGVTVNALAPGGPANTRMIPATEVADRSTLIQPEAMIAPITWLMSPRSDAYGDISSRPGLPLTPKSVAAIAMTAAIGRANELRVHVNGALTNGCTADEIRDILLLVALYCGIPAAIEGHRVALDVLRERGAL